MVVVIDPADMSEADKELVKEFIRKNFNEKNKRAGIYATLSSAMTESEKMTIYREKKQYLEDNHLTAEEYEDRVSQYR